ncbi:MAG: UDP-N-acetylglucosamine 1-carboxyvinyltransferase [Oscillospiraceae bacterium]|nr:UDP-N-acetylglucosamine 1-carboxyvinyltransferase [Oscillospiraceae bacterium]
MEKFEIIGGKPLYGEISVCGAKNAAVAIIPAALLVDGVCRIENIPDIKDVKLIIQMLRHLGANVEHIDETTISIDATNLTTHIAAYDMASRMRASYYLLGALLGRLGKAEVALPGGCNFGVRPINLHEKGFRALGATVNTVRGQVIATAEELRGNTIYLDTASVGATINIMLAAVLAKGRTVIENAAREPHIVDVANFLNTMGANVRGAGTEVIRITGVERLRGGSYSIIPDQIEAGTFMLAAAAAGGNVLVKNIIPKHMESIVSKLEEMGVKVTEYDDSIRIEREGEIHGVRIKTNYYPGFPTDMQPQMVVLMTTATGTSIMTEDVWDNRFQYIGELQRMGADIRVEGKSAIINGGRLSGAPIKATDLRAGAAMIIAGLAAEGKTVINDTHYIDRGYSCIEDRLRSIGADIERIYEV